MPYKVCIIAAGRGTRLSSWKTIHKALLPVGNKAVISHIIEKFPSNIEIVIALGYKADQIKDYLSIAHPDQHITYVEVDKWQGVGSGPGYSLLACQPHLTCPFIFTGADTIVLDQIPEPTKNWIGVAEVEETTPYLLAQGENQKVTTFHDKQTENSLREQGVNLKNIKQNAFIGLAGVHDWKDFWQALKNSQNELTNQELQVRNGLQGLLPKKLTTTPFTWFDTGNDSNYQETNHHFPQVVAPKTDEQLYMQQGLVIKFFADQTIAQKRVDRAAFLPKVIPPITHHQNNFYAYKKVPGELISEIKNPSVFENFLQFCQTNLWQPTQLTEKEKQAFDEKCHQFYYQKTLDRINLTYQTTDITDNTWTINGQSMPLLEKISNQVDWKNLAQGHATTFHGDLQPENIIVTPNNSFALIDWRQDFAGILEYGDAYYDFAKLDHALLINGHIIRQNHFSISEDKANQAITFEFHIRSHLQEYRQIFHSFLQEHGYDLNKLKTISYLTFLNIAPLHHQPYNKFLYYLGKYLLHEHLQTNRSNPTALRHRKNPALATIPA